MKERFIKSALTTFATRVLVIALGMGISVVIARALGSEGQGIFSLAILLPSVLMIFTNCGINVSSTFYLGKKKYSPREVLGANIILTFLISIITILIGLIIIFFSNELFPRVEREYTILALFLIPFTLFFENVCPILLGLQKIKEYNFIFFLQSFFFLVLIVFFLLVLRPGVKAAIIAQIISFVLAGAILFFLSKKETEGIILRLNREYLRHAFSYGFKVYLSSIFNLLHYRMSLFLINLFLNPIAVGFYAISTKLAEGVTLFSTSTATVLFPKVSSETQLKNIKDFTPLVCRIVLFICLIVSIMLCILSHWIIVLFYSENFLASIAPFRILLIGTFAVSGYTILINDLGGRGKPLISTYITGFAVTLNIILNILLIPQWGIKGAAMAGSFSYSLMFIVTVYVYSKISGNKIREILLLQKADIYRILHFLRPYIKI